MASARFSLRKATNGTFWLRFDVAGTEQDPPANPQTGFANANLAIDALKTQIGLMTGTFSRTEGSVTTI